MPAAASGVKPPSGLSGRDASRQGVMALTKTAPVMRAVP